MVRRTDPKDDDWKNVKDAKKRKQIQDRLAQRARRQRLRQVQLDSSTFSARPRGTQHIRSSNTGPSPSQHSSTSSSSIVLLDSPTDAIDPALDDATISSTTSDTVQPLLSNVSKNKHVKHWLSDALRSYTTLSIAQPNPPFTVFSALYVNGEIQGLFCSTTHVSRTPTPKPHIPLPLHPTEIQLMIAHPRWYDRLPFPKMRDSLIKLRGVIDEEELLKDLYCIPSWTITPGQACWDPRAWVMEREWAEKWAWLMF